VAELLGWHVETQNAGPPPETLDMGRLEKEFTPSTSGMRLLAQGLHFENHSSC
jgi:hypothetical protein